MENIVLRFDKSSFEISKRKMVSGVIYFDFGNYQFPEDNWNDFVVIILNWWLTALDRIISNESIYEELNFMDGPLYVKVMKIDADTCSLNCIESRPTEKVEFSGEYGISEVFNTILKAAKLVYDYCISNGWASSDIDELSDNIEKYI